MPRLSETSPKGTILRWMVEPGMPIQKGQAIVQVESDKAIVELESPCTGRLQGILCREGDIVEAAAILAQIAEPEDDDRISDPPSVVAREEHFGQAKPSVAGPSLAPRGPRPPRVTQRTRRLRRSSIPEPHPADLQGVEPLEQPTHFAETLPPHEVLPLSTIRSRIGANLLASQRTAPHAFVEVEADVSPMVARRADLATWTAEARPSYTAIFIQAAAVALKSFPDLNVSLRGSQVYRWRQINIGVAVARLDGLIVPVIPDADSLTLTQIMARLRSFGSSHQDPLPPEACSAGTFTISNLGMYGADNVLSIIHPGQTGILSLGRIVPKPRVLGGEIAVRSMLRMTLAFDHRVLDGAQGARFLVHFSELLAAPEGWAH